ncbi:uncharacterized protein PADG_12097 [Paracoccidioides brasiliensis Pb18]|uniref:Retrotransposon gag domain-containing protein n=1 Tax=Paracoccidioides brasiliensis (strain Pb18) TaxID=502780 RepID=A0A0A0HU18_PARBD|nr:uncharacterized protein PADG_12097 [Paracoccidioides brasiliensis Pb18]KGM91783.1 hypothetical protein PADG_12097 [Paracoccidioides brasiliensis Pb18]
MNAKSVKQQQQRIVNAKLQQKWQQYYTNLETPITWNEFCNWIHARIINPDKANQDCELKYQELKQSEGQTIHDFVSTLQSIEEDLRKKYTHYHRKIHIFDKILPSFRAGFERYAVKLDDLSYDGFIMRLGIIESNIKKITTPSSAAAQQKSASRGNNSHGVAPAAPEMTAENAKSASTPDAMSTRA